MIRVAFVTDTHASESNRWAEHCRIMDWMAQDIVARGCALAVHGGDLYHSRSTPGERAFVADWLKKIAEFCPVALVAGNHDNASDVVYLQRLASRFPITAVDVPQVLTIACVSLMLLPWPRKANVLAAIGRPVGQEESSIIAQEALRSIFIGLRAQMPEGSPRLFVGHVMIDGAKTDHNQPIVGADMAVSVADLGLADCQFYACGHVHAEQHEMWNEAPVVYGGAPYHCNFGEPGPASYSIVEFEDGKLARWYRVPTPATPMILLKADWQDGQLVFVDVMPKTSGAEVRLRYVCDSDQRQAAKAAAEELRAGMIAGGAILVKLEEVVETTTRARTPEIASAKTLADKMAVLWKARGIELGKRAPAVLAKLNVLEGEL